MGASHGQKKGEKEEIIKDIDVENLQDMVIQNKELYLIELMAKKKKMTDFHVNDGSKPTNDENVMMTRINIEITELFQKIFLTGKKRKTKIKISPELPVFKYSGLQTEYDVLTWQWAELRGEHEELKDTIEKKQKREEIRKMRKLHRKDPFYEESELSDNESNYNNNDQENVVGEHEIKKPGQEDNEGEGDEEEEEEDEEN